jgi:hypothetical protein
MSNFSSTYPSVSPTYQIDFANGKRIPPNATFSRSDSPIDATKAAASAVHYWSNEKHLSSENLLSYSSDISQSAWTKDGLSETGGQTAPDGGTDAYKLAENSATSYHRIYAALTADGGAITLSAYVKYIGRQWVYVRLNDSTTTRRAWFDVQNGATGTADSQFSSTTITASGNGYYKITATLPNSSTSSSFAVIASAGSDGSYSTFAGLNADAFAVWGIQVSSTGETVLNETSGQIHREYAPTLKSVATAGDARFEYDPTDGQSAGTSLGILVEGQSTNKAAYSEDFSNGVYTYIRSSVDSNVGIAPDGTLTADLLREDSTASNNHFVSAATATGLSVGSTQFTVSVFVKAAGRNKFRIFDNNQSTSGETVFDLSAGTVESGSGAIESCSNGWFRCSITPTCDGSALSTVYIQLYDSTSSVYTGNGYSGIMLWGFQLETGQTYSSSYISTSGATATRAADSLSVVSSSLFDNGEGALFVENKQPNATQNNAVASITDGGSSNYVRIRGNFGNFRGEVYNNAAIQADLFGGTNDTNFHKQCITFGNNNVSFYVDGNEKGSTDTTGVIPELNTIRLGYAPVTGNGNQHIRRVAVYGSQISETEAAALTS